MENDVIKEGNLFKRYFSKMKGDTPIIQHFSVVDALIGAFGGFICIFTFLELAEFTTPIWILASFAPSGMLAFIAWNAPVGQPRNIIGSHLIASFIGISMLKLFGSSPLLISIAVCLTIFCMLLTRTFHPPACGNALIIMIEGYSWSFLFTTVLLGTIIITLYALIINNLHPRRKYPMYW